MKSWLYCPGDSPKMMVNAGVYEAEGIVLDLEDSVASADKDEARALVAEALAGFDFGTALVAVRINGLASPWWEEDLDAVIAAGAQIIRVPKVESAESVLAVAARLDALEKKGGRDSGSVRVQCILETPLGVERAFAIAAASPRVEALSFGAEDYCAETGIRRDGPVYALDYARSRIVAAAAAFGLASCDTVWAAYKDTNGLRQDAERARILGFDGKSLVHPDQVEIVNAVFSPSEAEKAWARRIVEHAADTGGAVSVDGAMVDAPVVRRARRILEQTAEPGPDPHG